MCVSHLVRIHWLHGFTTFVVHARCLQYLCISCCFYCVQTSPYERRYYHGMRYIWELPPHYLFIKLLYFPCFDMMGKCLYSNLEMLSLLYNLALSDCHHRQLSKPSVLSLEMFFCLLRVDLTSCKH